MPCVRYGEIYTTYGIWFDECVSHTDEKNIRSPKYFERYVMIGKNKNGSPKWIDRKKWDAAIRARKNGTATKEPKEMLDHGHWKAK